MLLAISNAFISSLIKNSSYAAEKKHYDVTFELDNVIAMEGTLRTVIEGDSFFTNLSKKISSRNLNVTVYMGKNDITSECYNNGVISISAVTDNVIVKASLKEVEENRVPANFYWKISNDGNSLVNVTNSFFKENSLTLTNGSITDGKFSKVKMTLSEKIILKHYSPWFIEWKSEGTWTDTTDGALLFAGAANSTIADTPYLYRRHNSDFIAFGISSGGRYYNYGVSLKANGIDGTKEHIYRLENRISSDGSNMVYLLVDGDEIAPMTHHWIGGTDQNKNVDWLNGRDLTFTHMGTSPHTIGNCYIDYIQVSEDGHEHIYENGTCTSCGYTPNIPEKPKSIEFYIENNIFNAIEGQTWSEWILSYGISAGDNGIVWIGNKSHPTMEDGFLYYSDKEIPLGAAKIIFKDTPIRFNDEILSTVYNLSATKIPQ